MMPGMFNPMQPFGGGQSQGVVPGLEQMTPEQRRAYIASALGLGQSEDDEGLAIQDLQAAQSSMSGPAARGYGALGGLGQGIASMSKSITGGIQSRAARDDLSKHRTESSGYRKALAEALAGIGQQRGPGAEDSDPLYYLKR